MLNGFEILVQKENLSDLKWFTPKQRPSLPSFSLKQVFTASCKVLKMEFIMERLTLR